MTIKTLTIESYRSIQKLELNLQQLNLITGHNGCGKSNVYISSSSKRSVSL